MKELSNDVILRAAAGEADALEEVLACYEPYINTLATKPVTLASGRVHYVIDEDCKSYIQMRLIEAILKWRVIPNDPAG